MAKLIGRTREFQDPDEKLARDYDPEADGQDRENSSGNDLSENEDVGTEHYVTVSKSKIREKEGPSLDRQYRGSRVSRQALEESDDENEDEDDDDSNSNEYDDLETADLEADTAEASDSEIVSDDALGDSDASQFDGFIFRGSSKPKKSKGQRATAADFMSDSGEEGESGGAELEDSDEDEDIDDGLDDLLNGGATSDEEEPDDDEEDEGDSQVDDMVEDDESGSDHGQEDRDKLDARPSLATAGNQVEVRKGIAIQEQRKVYDGLLNVRIRLQKALIAANTFPTLENESNAETEVYEAAEEAAIKLLNTISDLRENLAPSTAANNKRKRGFESSSFNDEIWEQIQQDFQRGVQFREDRLEKWSRKVQSVTVAAPNKLGAKPTSLSATLREQLNIPDGRLVKRTRTPRSCAPVQAAMRITESKDIFDDADFYQLLLKELVDQRTVESATEQSNAVAAVMLTANKEAKSRKVVDRKASKGRKMRFTLHEKLQNFMASEDRRTWEQEAIDRFFGTLFGQKMELNEDESVDEDLDTLYSNDGVRLFR